MKLSLSLHLTLSHESSLAGERAHTRCRIRNRARDCEQEKERERDEEIFEATLKHKQHLLLAASHQCRLSTGREMVKGGREGGRGRREQRETEGGTREG